MQACDKNKNGQAEVHEVAICVSLACNGTIVLSLTLLQ